jgi:uncharacterized membrane protein YidH (DUF202 family)
MSATVDKLTAGVPKTLDESTRLSVKRTQLSAERTLMSWIRTAFSMISFGFTIGKFLDYLANQADSRLPLGEHNLLPKLLVLIGLASLFIGIWEHRHLMCSSGCRRTQACSRPDRYRGEPCSPCSASWPSRGCSSRSDAPLFLIIKEPVLVRK